MITFAPQGYRLAFCTMGPAGPLSVRGHVLLPGLTHLRSILSPARHWGDC